MSKSKRAKSGSAHDVTRWENGLVHAIVNEDEWKTCIFFLVSNKLEDNFLIDITCEVVSTGLRKCFSVVTRESLFKEVKEFVKASSGGGGKGKTAAKLPEYVEICEQVKPFIDQQEDIPITLLAKLLKFKILHLKAKDLERREEAKKEKAKESVGKKGDKRSASPGKSPKSPKKKGKKGEPEPPPSPKKDTKLKRRGEVEDTFKTIDDEPDDEGSPQHYILVHGFTVASTLHHLSNIGVNVDAIIKVKKDEYRTVTPVFIKENKIEKQQTEKGDNDDDKDDDDDDGRGVSQMDQTDEIINQQKEEEKLAMFWKESDALVLNAPTGHKLKDIAKYEVEVTNAVCNDSVDVDKKTEFGTAIFEKVANVCYDMLDHQKSYQRYLSAMKLLHVPLHTPCAKDVSLYQSAPPAPDTPKAVSCSVEIDRRYYNHLISSIPDESLSVPLVLHCVVEQVVASVDETNPLDKEPPVREDGLNHELAAHFSSRTAGLALSAEEKQVLLEPENKKKRRENKIPHILNHSDKLSQRLHYLENLTVMDGLETELAMLEITASRALDEFPHRTVADFNETNARFHQLIQCCSFENPDIVSRFLKNYTFEGMPLKCVDSNDNVVEPFQLDETFCSYKNPWDDPYCDLSKYFTALDKGQVTEEESKHSRVSAAVDLVSFRNLDDWCFKEEFDKNTLTQVLNEARLTTPYIDTYYHKQDDTLLLVFHNPVSKQLHNRSVWNVRLHSNVGFRNYLEHISNMISDWSTQQDLLEEEKNRTPTPAPPTPELPKLQIKTGSRYGLKTRAEIAALKAEEEDKGKKKGKRSARSRTPKSGKKSQALKEGPEKKGSPQKNGLRTTSGSLSRGAKSSKARLTQEVAPQPDVTDEGGHADKEEYDFLGYDVGDDLLHVTGVQSCMFPSDGGQIRVEKTRYVHCASTVSASVYKDGNILKLHFLDPQEDIIEENRSGPSLKTKEESCRSVIREETPCGDEVGVEKSEFEENEKQADSQFGVSLEKQEPEPLVFSKYASFVAQLNDGMVISSSGYGVHGIPPAKKDRDSEGNPMDPCLGQTQDPSPPPKAASPKSKKKNDEEARRLEELRQAEERKRAEEEARRLEELRNALKKPFHEIFISCPDGLRVSFKNDENYGSVDDAGGVLVRQRYPLKSRGLHECEAVRARLAMEEKSRCIRTDGTVVKIMLDDSVDVLYPDGMTSRCPVFPSKLQTSADRQPLEAVAQPSGRKAPTNTLKSEDEPTDQCETASSLLAEWTTVTADGERLIQNLDGSKTYLEPVKLSVATCPVSNQIYKTREDNVVIVIRPDGTQIVEHSDGTRITTFYKEIKTEIVAADHETGEEAKYESHLCRHVKVECDGFATVVMETEHGSVETLFGNGSAIKTEPNGDCVLNKCDGSQIAFDIKGNVTFVPRDVWCDNRGTISSTKLTDRMAQRPGVYYLRTTSQHCCDVTDQQGNSFSVFANGEIMVTKCDEDTNSSTTAKQDDGTASVEVHSKQLNGTCALSSLSLTPHVPRFFVMRRDGTGFELLRNQDVHDYLNTAKNDVGTAVIKTPVEGFPGVTGITVLKPFTGGIGKTWLKGKDEKNLIPEGLRERDFKTFPVREFKKIGPKFGTTAGSGLNIGNMRKIKEIKPRLTCPKVLVLRHLIQHEPADITHRQSISAAFQKYGDYVMERQLQADNLLPRQPRANEELEKARKLYDPSMSTKFSLRDNNDVLSQQYLKSVIPTEEPPIPPPAWKRPPEAWERDRIELAKLDYGKHALRFQEVPPYFETSQGQDFLTGLQKVPDMKKLAADLDKRACPDRPATDLSGSSTPVENGEYGSGTHGISNLNDSKSTGRYSSVVLENLNDDDQPIQSSTPFASRPVNPTPAQAAGRPTPTSSVRPTNPTPRQASTVTGYENNSDSPRISHVQSDYTPLEALLETRNEISYEEEECRVNNDTAIDLNSSANSQYNDDGRVKSLYVDVTGSPRKDPVKLPKAILGSKPGALPNTQFSAIEDPVRRKIQTVSVSGKNLQTMRGFELLPSEVDFGVLKEGCTYIQSVNLKNIGIDTCRFKIRQPPPSTGMKILYTPGPVAAGMSTKLDVEIFAIAVGVSGESGIGSIGHHIEIVGETDIIYLPVSAAILTAYEYDNRSPAAPQGGPSRGTQMISNRPPSREAIRPRREHLFSNVLKQF